MSSGAFLVFFIVAMVIRVVFYLRRAEQRKAEVLAQVPRDDPRWGPGTLEPQIVGRACVDCGEKIVMANDGKACGRCGEVAHKKRCLKAHRAHAHRAESGSAYR